MKKYIQPETIVIEAELQNMIALSTGGDTTGGNAGAKGYSDFDDYAEPADASAAPGFWDEEE